jgi:hypothetical protein
VRVVRDLREAVVVGGVRVGVAVSMAVVKAVTSVNVCWAAGD